ncbi:MAG TPA: SRPBCC domain-containing protein [Vicinamibacterales bacterium]
MNQGLIASVSTTITARSADVWQALVTPAAIKQYMFGTTVTSDWVVGSPISWKGEWQGRAYEDKGIILQVVPERVLEYSHFSPLAGVPDVPENYHVVTVELSPDGERTRVALSQDNNPTERARERSERNWGMMLAALKQFLEQ